MSNLNKGDYGYLKKRKSKQLLLVIGSFALVLLVLITGIIKFKTRNNIFTVGAVVLVLPAARILVNYLLMVNFPFISEDDYNRIKNLSTEKIFYDMVLAVKDKIIKVPCMAITSGNVILYVPDSKLSSKDIEEAIGKFIGINGLFPTIKVFTEQKKFENRLENLPSEEKSAERVIENILILHI